MEIKIESLDGIRAAAKEFVANIGDATVFAFYGSMGAGKTDRKSTRLNSSHP